MLDIYREHDPLQPVGESEPFLLKPGFVAAGDTILSGLGYQIA